MLMDFNVFRNIVVILLVIRQTKSYNFQNWVLPHKGGFVINLIRTFRDFVFDIHKYV